MNTLIFSVCRNPVDRVISIYKYWGFSRSISFDVFCSDIIARPWALPLSHTLLTHLRPQFDFVSLNGSIPSYIKLIRYENLGVEVNRMARENGWNNFPATTKFNISDSSKVVVSPPSLEIIKSTYRRDFDAFGY